MFDEHIEFLTRYGSNEVDYNGFFYGCNHTRTKKKRVLIKTIKKKSNKCYNDKTEISLGLRG